MIHKIYNFDAGTLRGMPETGMGYQVVEASKYGQREVRRYIVYNSELAVNFDTEFKAN